MLGLNIMKLMQIAKKEYLDGQNCTSSTVSSWPWYTPLGSTVGLSEFFRLPDLADGLPLGVDKARDFDDSAREEMWSCMLHKTTDLSFPIKGIKK